LFRPAISTFNGRSGQVVGTPAIDSGVFGDVYLTFDAVGGSSGQSAASVIPNLPAGAIALGVVVEPLLPWIWIGGLLVGVGGLLCLLPRPRPKRTAPASPSPVVTTASPVEVGAGVAS